VKHNYPNPRAAFTLLELVLATVILTVALSTLALFGGRSADALGSSTAQSELDTRLRRTLARLGDELLASGLGTLVPDAAAPAGATAQTYRRSDGVLNGAIRWTTPMRFAFAYEVGELDDGLDNNGNGLVDEGVVQWTRELGQADEQTVVLCHGVRELGPGELDNDLDDDGDGLVDERGLAFERVGNTLRVSLTLERGSGGRMLTRTLETAVQPRN
jgi:hypothetical protein